MHLQLVASDLNVKTTDISYSAAYKLLNNSNSVSCFTSISFSSFITSFKRQTAHVKIRTTEHESDCHNGIKNCKHRAHNILSEIQKNLVWSKEESAAKKKVMYGTVY